MEIIIVLNISNMILYLYSEYWCLKLIWNMNILIIILALMLYTYDYFRWRP